jgi:hypothetical protein
MGLLVAETYQPRVRPMPLVDGPLPAALRESALGRANAPALEAFANERARIDRDLWLAVVPGASEQWGHHRAPPARIDTNATRISDEFIARIDHAMSLLTRDVVRFVLISGGSVDRRRPEYNEAHRGRAHLLSRYAAQWSGPGALADRVLVDPLACHSTTNLRNAARLAVQLGLDRLVIATSMPPTPILWPRLLPVVGQTNQGWYFLHHRVSTFDWRCRRTLGYVLGRFEWHAPHGIRSIVLRDLPRERLMRDVYGP